VKLPVPCVRSWHPSESSLLVKRVLRMSVLLIICRSWVRAPPAPSRFTCGFSAPASPGFGVPLHFRLQFELVAPMTDGLESLPDALRVAAAKADNTELRT
jgi:hypothetical protein